METLFKLDVLEHILTSGVKFGQLIGNIVPRIPDVISQFVVSVWSYGLKHDQLIWVIG